MFEPVAKDSPSTRELVDVVEFQGWSHLVEWLIPYLHEKEVKKFYINLEIQFNDSFKAKVNNVSFRITEGLLGKCCKLGLRG